MTDTIEILQSPYLEKEIVVVGFFYNIGYNNDSCYFYNPTDTKELHLLKRNDWERLSE